MPPTVNLANLVSLETLAGPLIGGQSSGPRSEARLAEIAAATHDIATRRPVGLPPEEVRAAVVIDMSGGTVLEALFSRYPDLTSVLLLEPHGPVLADGLMQLATAGWRGVDPRRCRVANLPNADGLALQLSAYLHLVQFAFDAGVPCGRVLLVEPTTTTDGRRNAALAGARDFTSGLGARLLDHLAASASPRPSLLRQVADALNHLGERYHALKFLWLLHQQTNDPAVASSILESFIDLRCPDWALRFAARAGIRDRLTPEVTSSLEEDCRRLLAERRDLLERNRAALPPQARALLPTQPPDHYASPELTDIPQLVAGPERFLVDRRPYRLLVDFTGPVPREINPPPDPSQLHAALAAPGKLLDAHGCVLGWGRHAAAARLMVQSPITTDVPGWQRLVFLLDEDVAELSAVMQTVDLTEVSRDPRVTILLGPDARRDLLTLMREDPAYCVPALQLGVDAELEEQLTAVAIERSEEVARHIVLLREHYDARAVASLLLKLENPDPSLRILFVTSLHTTVVRYTVHDFADAFRERGHLCRVLEESRAGQNLHLLCLSRELLEFRPDLVVLVNHLRPEAGELFPPGLPLVVWVQDELPWLRDAGLISRLGPLDLTYGFNTLVRDSLRSLGYPHAGHLPFAIAAKECDGDIPEHCRDEVVFATHLILEREPACTPGLRAWIERRFPPGKEPPCALPEASALVDQAVVDLGLEVPPQLRSAVNFWVVMALRNLSRMFAADLVVRAGFRLALYGQGWQKIDRFRPHARGTVAPGEPLREILRAHKVVLHANPGGNMHPRVLQGYAAGGFVIAKHDGRDDLPGETVDQFDVGRELMLYRSTKEMSAIIRRAMKDEAWRRQVILAAQSRIRRCHTYLNRMDIILADLPGQLRRHTEQFAAAESVNLQM